MSSKCTAIHNAISKYGKENFKIEQIDIALDLVELNAKENYYIKLFNTLAPNGYNLDTGGCNKQASDIAKQRISDNHADVKGSNNPMFGMKRPEVGERNKRLKSKAVQCVETGTIYESIREAERQHHLASGHISAVCRGKYGSRTAGGYHWQYI